LNTTTSRCDLLVSSTTGSFFKLSGTVCGKYRVSVCIDKTRKYHTPTRINHLTTLTDEWLDFGASANSLDPVVSNEKRAITNARKFAQLCPDPWSCGSSESYELRTVN
jgi:hypothetical protein